MAKFLDFTGLSHYDDKLKAWVKTLTDGIKSVSIEVVNILPTVSDGKTNVIYFVRKQEQVAAPEIGQRPDMLDVYDEYVLVGGNYEHIGSTWVDLSDYATREWVTQQISDAIGKIVMPTVATSDKLGLVKIGATGLAAKQYPVQLDSQQRMYVAVPWEDTVDTAITNIEIDNLFNV